MGSVFSIGEELHYEGMEHHDGGETEEKVEMKDYIKVSEQSDN